MAALEAHLQALEEAVRELVRELKNDRVHLEERVRRLEDAVIRLGTRATEGRWLIGMLLPVLLGAIAAQVLNALR